MTKVSGKIIIFTAPRAAAKQPLPNMPYPSFHSYPSLYRLPHAHPAKVRWMVAITIL